MGSVDELRGEVEEWLASNWDPDLSVDDWWALVAASGWAAPHFSPEVGGKGLDLKSQAVVRKTFLAQGALRPPGGIGLIMAAPTILTHGTTDQIDRHVAPILDGRLGWCQLFSEPGAGSDLAGLTTRAERDGNRWIIKGQKVWSSQAALADWGMLVCRTDFGVPKHDGLSWFAFRLDQPGVEVRPLREMTGDETFSEVFIDGAIAEDTDLIGGAGNGWKVTQTTLHFERTGIGAGGGTAGFPFGGPKGGMLGRRAGHAAMDRPAKSIVMLGYEEALRLAREHGRADDPLVRQELTRLYSDTVTGDWNARRARAEADRGGGESLASVGKLAKTRIAKRAGRLCADLVGARGTLAGPDGAWDGAATKGVLFCVASSIYGGADEIQRNIVAERTLGLPREPAVDRGRPFGDVVRDRATGAR